MKPSTLVEMVAIDQCKGREDARVPPLVGGVQATPERRTTPTFGKFQGMVGRQVSEILNNLPVYSKPGITTQP